MRTIALLLLLAAFARAEKELVRVVHGEQPFPHAALRVVAPEAEIRFDRDAFEAEAFTDERGEAVVAVAPGARVMVYAPGFALGIATFVGRPSEVVLRPEQTLAGSVVDSKGKGVPYATVHLRTTYRQMAFFTVRCDEEGNYRFAALWLDDVVVYAEASGYLKSDEQRRTPGGEFSPILLARPCTLRGIAVDEEGNPLAGLDLICEGLKTRTDENGRFLFGPLAPGFYKVTGPAPYTRERFLYAVSEGDDDEQRVGFRRPAVVLLRVTDEAGAPLPSARVDEQVPDESGAFRLELAHLTPLQFTVTADGFAEREIECNPAPPAQPLDLGAVQLKALEPSTILVLLPDGKVVPEFTVDGVIYRDGLAVGLFDSYPKIQVEGYALRTVPIAPGERVEVLLEPPAWFEGRILSPDGKPVAGARVRISDRVECLSNEEGAFRLGPLLSKEHLLQVDATGFLSWKAHLAPVAATSCSIRLERALAQRSVHGRVLRGGESVTDFILNGTRFIDDGGRFKLDVPDTAGASLTLQLGRHRHYAYEVEEGEGEMLLEVPTGRILVELAGGERGAKVRLYSSHDFQSFEAICDERGVAHIEGLRAGYYGVAATEYATTRAFLGENEELSLMLHPHAIALLRVHTSLGESTHSCNTSGYDSVEIDLGGGVSCSLRAFDLAVGEERRIDLAPLWGGTLSVSGDSRETMRARLEGTQEGYEISLSLQRGMSVLLPPGSYSIEGHGREDVLIRAGEETSIFMPEVEMREFTGRVLFEDGEPALGARVQSLYPGGSVYGECRVLADGRFITPALDQGEWGLVAGLEGYIPARARLFMERDGVREEGLPLILRRADGSFVSLRGPVGERVLGAWAGSESLAHGGDALGRLYLGRIPITLTIGAPGYATIRNRRIEATGTTILMERAATLRIVAPGVNALPRLSVGGQEWPLELLGGRARLRDLPAGPAQLTWEGEAPPDPLNLALVAGEELVLKIEPPAPGSVSPD